MWEAFPWGNEQGVPARGSSHGGTETSFSRAEAPSKTHPWGNKPGVPVRKKFPFGNKLRSTVRVSDHVGRFPQRCIKAAAVLSFLI